jgi:hypothetical protein
MITIRLATENDSAGLLVLSAMTPMSGTISIRIDRYPDFFDLLKQRGPYIAIIAEDEEKEIVGSFTATRQTFYIDKQAVSVYYLADLKVHPGYTGTTLAYRLVKAMREELESSSADLLLCTTADGNQLVSPFFNGKAGIPPFEQIATCIIHQLLPSPNYNDESAAKLSRTQLPTEDFYLEVNKRYGCYPAPTDLSSCMHFTHSTNGNIIASVSAADTSAYKQNILIDYPFFTAVALRMLRITKNIFDLPDIPKKNDALKLLYVKYWGCVQGHEHILARLINDARGFAFQNNYHFLSIPVDEKDVAMLRLMKKWRSFNFRSNILMTSLRNNEELVHYLKSQLIYEDYSLV